MLEETWGPFEHMTADEVSALFENTKPIPIEGPNGTSFGISPNARQYLATITALCLEIDRYRERLLLSNIGRWNDAPVFSYDGEVKLGAVDCNITFNLYVSSEGVVGYVSRVPGATSHITPLLVDASSLNVEMAAKLVADLLVTRHVTANPRVIAKINKPLLESIVRVVNPITVD